MNIGFWCCIVLVPGFGILGIIFGIFKEKAARFVSGFNTLTQEEQDMYDKADMVKDMRNTFFLWMTVMLIGTLLSLFATQYAAIIAYAIWLILFFKDVHLDAHKAFKKYLIK